jgi:hypothetical protein
MVGGTGWSVHFDPTNRLNSFKEKLSSVSLFMRATRRWANSYLSLTNEWHQVERAHKFKFCPRVAFLPQTSTDGLVSIPLSRVSRSIPNFLFTGRIVHRD